MTDTTQARRSRRNTHQTTTNTTARTISVDPDTVPGRRVALSAARAAHTTAAPHRATGTYRPHPRGFGFVDLDAPLELPGKPAGTEPVTSCFVPPNLVEGLLDADRVALTVDLADGRGTAAAIRMTSRTRTQVFGVVEAAQHGKCLRLDPHVGHGRWALQGPAPVNGAAVLADVVAGGARTATVAKVWPAATSAEALRERVLARHQISVAYPDDVLEQAASIVDGTHARFPAKRTDLTGRTTITIDAASSRDLDDALSARRNADGSLTVWVHIADVAAHLQPGSPLDREAARTGTSVYLPGWNRPMLPPELSEGSLSLLPGVVRDTLTVEMSVAEDGTLTSVEVYASTIKSDARVTYTDAAQVMAGKTPAESHSGTVTAALRLLAEAADRISAQRADRGGVDAGRSEAPMTVAVDASGMPVAVAAGELNAANLVVERLMVAANESVAAWLLARELPAMFRTHPAPDRAATARLGAYCDQFGVAVNLGEQLTPQGASALATALKSAALAAQAGVWEVLMSGMGRAQYTPHAGQHFGLGSSAYLHFTSPIRRYADVLVHRAVHAHLYGLPAHALPGAGELVDVGHRLNEGAAVAARAEAHARKAMWMTVLADQVRAHPGKVFTGHVSGVSAKGVFVTLDGSRVSGMLSVRTLPGRDWATDEHEFVLARPEGGRFALGEPIEVKVLNASSESGQLELCLPSHRPALRRSPRGGTRARPGQPSRRSLAQR